MSPLTLMLRYQNHDHLNFGLSTLPAEARQTDKGNKPTLQAERARKSEPLLGPQAGLYCNKKEKKQETRI